MVSPRLVAIIPVKHLSACKQRLGSVLDSPDRARLCLAMLEDVVTAVGAAAAVDAVWVTSPDPVVLARAAAAGARPLPDTSGSLNGALAAALAEAEGTGARAVLIVQGDVPGVTAQEVIALVAAAPAAGPAVVVCPTVDGGTGAIYLRPPGVLAPRFGPGSGRLHRGAAEAAGIPVATVSVPGLAQDVDRMEDLAAFWSLDRPGRTRGVLQSVCLPR